MKRKEPRKEKHSKKFIKPGETCYSSWMRLTKWKPQNGENFEPKLHPKQWRLVLNFKQLLGKRKPLI